MAPSLDLLRTFLAVYREGSFTRAAAHLSLSQPAVTAQVKALETEVGRPLFIRRPRGAEPTPAADLLARRVADPLDRLDALTTGGLVDATDPFAHPVRLGGPAELTTARVLPALARLVAAGLHLRVTLGVADDLAAALTSGAIDLAVTTVRPRHRALRVHPLCDEEFLLVAAPRWADQLPPNATAHDYAQLPLISYAEDLPIIRRYWQTVFHTRPTHTATLVVPDLHAVLTATTAGAGLTVLPQYLCTAALHTGSLVVLRHPPLPPINTLYLATRANALSNPAVPAVRDRLLTDARHW